MSTRASADRYARALLDVVIQEGSPEETERELSALAEVFASNAELRTALTHPAVAVSAKRGVIEGIVARTGTSPPVGKLLLLLADRNRLSLLPDLAAAYRERVMAHQGVMRADLTTAQPLASDEATRVEHRLAEATGCRVMLTTQVDPSLIGGAVARLGGTVYDGSIATRLARMRERLEEQR